MDDKNSLSPARLEQAATRVQELRTGMRARRDQSSSLNEEEKRSLANSEWLKGDEELQDLMEDAVKIESLLNMLKESNAAIQAKAAAQAAQQIDSKGKAWTKVWANVTNALRPVGATTHAGEFESSVRVRWDFMQAIMLFLSVFFIPLMLAHETMVGWSAWNTVELLVDVFFGLDIIIGACTPFYTDDSLTLISKPKPVIIHYLRTSFLTDILVAFPLGSVLQADGRDSMEQLLRLSQALRVFKALRKARSASKWHRIQRLFGQASSQRASVIKLLLALVLTWHWMACIWWFIITHDGSASLGFHAGIWVVSPPVNGGGNGDVSSITGTGVAYLISFHWAVSVTTCIGTPPLPVCTPWQAAMESITCAVGVCMQSAFFGAAAEAYNASNEQLREKLRKLAQIQKFIRQRSVPQVVGERVSSYQSFMTTRMRPSEEAALIQDLPSALRIQIAVVLNEKYLMRVKMFQSAASRSIALLALALKQRTCMPNEIIVVAGNFNDKLYLIRTGILHVYVKTPEAKGITSGADQRRAKHRYSMKRPSIGCILQGVGMNPMRARASTNFMDTPVSKHGGLATRMHRSRRHPRNKDGEGNHKTTHVTAHQTKDDHDFGTCVAILREGMAFGEQSFLHRNTSKATVRTFDFTELMTLHRSSLESVFTTDPELKKAVKLYISETAEKYKVETCKTPAPPSGGIGGDKRGWAVPRKAVKASVDTTPTRGGQKATQMSSSTSPDCCNA